MNNYEHIADLSEKITSAVSNVILGKENEIRLILTAIFSGGHVLLDDYPGTGKTTLARSLAAVISCSTSRIQFTPDLLPSDITGINYFNVKDGEFIFRSGPIFANIVIGDEMLTPDSSRFWPKEGYEAGKSQPSFDKQFARDWLKANEGHDWTLPQDIVDKTIEKYLQSYELLTGTRL